MERVLWALSGLGLHFYSMGTRKYPQNMWVHSISGAVKTVVRYLKVNAARPSRRQAQGRGCKGALEAFDLRHQKIQVCTEKFEEFDARTGMG